MLSEVALLLLVCLHVCVQGKPRSQVGSPLLGPGGTWGRTGIPIVAQCLIMTVEALLRVRLFWRLWKFQCHMHRTKMNPLLLPGSWCYKHFDSVCYCNPVILWSSYWVEAFTVLLFWFWLSLLSELFIFPQNIHWLLVGLYFSPTGRASESGGLTNVLGIPAQTSCVCWRINALWDTWGCYVNLSSTKVMIRMPNLIR